MRRNANVLEAEGAFPPFTDSLPTLIPSAIRSQRLSVTNSQRGGTYSSLYIHKYPETVRVAVRKDVGGVAPREIVESRKQ